MAHISAKAFQGTLIYDQHYMTRWCKQKQWVTLSMGNTKD